MAYSKIALLLIFNVIFFTLVSSTSVPFPKLTCKDSLKFKVCANALNLAKVSTRKGQMLHTYQRSS
ncbi:hypothetical protein Bca52824_068902 [Brassica carinata]|uniref:Uncharacterized protein n=1 Tax=Brassica carinata TaxID=52824 RepID=A0A8X7Q2R6_BRACI|nr:hypothetical protein Bca52824_068902 [Brassica carinata]